VVNLGSLLFCLAAGTAVGAIVVSRNGWRLGVRREEKAPPRTLVANLIRDHFRPVAIDDITISERSFPFRVRADLQRAIDRLFGSKTTIRHFCGVRQDYSHNTLTLSACIASGDHNPPVAVPPQYEEIDVGDEQPLRCLKNGIWFLEEGPNRSVVLLTAVERYGESTGIQFQIGTVNNADGTRLTQQFFRHLEESVLKAESYRGKILSLEQSPHSYS